MTYKGPGFIKEEILRKTKFKTITEGKYKGQSMVKENSITISFYPDEIVIDYQESTNLLIYASITNTFRA